MNRVACLVVIILLFPGTSALLGQTPFLKQHHLFRGKEDYTVNVIYQDPKGWIWFGTDRGLFRYDGITDIRYTTTEGLASDNVTAINSNTDGKLWIGHKNGKITIFDGNEFNLFSPEESLGKIEITDIAADSTGTIYYSTNGEGVFMYDGRYLTNLNTDDGISDNFVYDIEIDSKGIVWFATDNGITRYNNHNCEVISMKDGLNDNLVRVLKASKDGRLWIGTDENGLTIYNPEDKSFTPIKGWHYGPITGFTISLENDIFLSTENQGIIQLQISDLANPIYRKITEKQGLISNRLKTLIKDIEENIWIGGNKGIIQALPPVFEFLNKTNGTPFEEIYSLTKDNFGNLWVCTEIGIYLGVPDANGQFEWSNISEELNKEKTNFISLFNDKEGQIWAGTYDEGVFRINPSNLKYKKYTIKEGLSDNNIISISGDENIVWFSTAGGGVTSYNLSDGRFKGYSNTELKESNIYTTKSDKSGKTWIAGSLKYPAYIFRDSLFILRGTGNRYPVLYSVAIDSSGGVWFNTGDKGIIKISGNRIDSIGKKEGIGFNEIKSIIFDKLNNLLVISDYGLIFYNTISGDVIEFGENSGLSYQYPIENSVFTDKNHQVWIGTRTGIIKYNPEYLKVIGQNPKVFISVKNLFSNPVKPGKKRFRFNENNFTFGYTGIWFTNAEGLNYRYMLEGFDLKWNYSKRNQNFTYSKLPDGDYSFRAEVSIDGKNWYSYKESVYSFRILTPFWKTWWFFAVVLISAISGVYWYIKRRVYNLEKAKEQLEKEVQKRTEEIRKQNKELEEQKLEIASQRDLAEEHRDKIEAQKEEIQSSIRYARRIQTASLPPKKMLDSILKEYFILNKPRDIVSGDFYWIAQDSAHTYFSVGDCTGHGVPGSFMSMLGISALNDIVKSLQTCKASTILNLLRDRIQGSLHQDIDNEMVTNDGMDIGLCIFDPDTRILQFAAAHNSMYLIRDGEIQIFPADKIDIGRFSNEKVEFNNHTIQCLKGDLIYLFTDGYADQFGGPMRKKYKSQKLRDFLISIHNEPLEKQKILLDEEIEAWKGNLLQVDDILIMGVKI
jgi:ligand-binding sensor domain-containing protein/serine phosphatase RsbU (regulator of sigma subunit)